MNYKYKVTATFEIIISNDDMVNWYAPGIGATAAGAVKDILMNIHGSENIKIDSFDFIDFAEKIN